MPSGICDTGRTILDFADVRPTCLLAPAYIGAGNVESTPIGFVRNGQSVEGSMPVFPCKDPCARVPFRAVEGPC